jgi:Fur family transcriptional regulator, peroxide stress response regulator
MIDKQVAVLREMGLKITSQRMAVLKALDGNTSHPSAIDIYRGLRPEHPTMSLATVYNTLEVLAKNGMLLELPITKDKMNYDPDTSEHDHAYCSSCGKIFDIFPGREAPRPRPDALEGFNVLAVRKVYYVKCRSCSAGGGP